MPRLTYRQIAQDLADRIALGEYPPGTLLPTGRALAEMYSVGTSTIDSAVNLLIDRGVIVGEQGRGRFVAERPNPDG